MLRKVSVGNLNGNDDFGLRPAPVARNGDNRAGGTALMSSWRPWAKLGSFGPGEWLKLELWCLSLFLKRIFCDAFGPFIHMRAAFYVTKSVWNEIFSNAFQSVDSEKLCLLHTSVDTKKNVHRDTLAQLKLVVFPH